MNLKLLLRNKGFLFFLLAAPMLSAFILNIKMEHSVYTEDEDVPKVIELDDCTKKAVYFGDTSAYIVKVYDASGSGLSEYVLNQMAENSMFSVCRSDVSGMTSEEALAQAKKDAFDDRAGVLLYFKGDFEQAVLDGDWKRGIQIYAVSEDERQELFETELMDLLGQIRQAQSLAGEDSGAIIEMLETITKEMPEKNIVSLKDREGVALTERQINQRTQIGYAFAFITLGFLFCGVFVAHTVIEEQNNKVFTRMMLSKIRSLSYFLSKFVVAFLICVLQTLVLGGCLLAMKNLDLGISIVSFLFVIFLLGLIFSILSMLLGIMLGDVMSSNYAVFTIWSISALLSGLYFPLDDTTAALKNISYLMPQKWFLDVSERLLVGDKSAYSMLFYVTVAYLVVIVTVGSVGLKMKRQES
ncbi:MAG: ABC transporter permease [Lachnospiraceae bacterium]|nr:ABC transporter permease [Lachnospiraceae bacterium]